MTFHVTDKTKTRAGKVRPRLPKKWSGRVIRRNLAICLIRFDETVKAFETREAIAEKKRNRPMRRRYLMALRELDDANNARCRKIATGRKRDAFGRFTRKRKRR